MNELIIIPLADFNAISDAVNRIIPQMRPYVPVVETTPQVIPVPDAEISVFANEGAFYDFLRDNRMLGPKISHDEFTGCDIIIKACHSAGWGISWVAYALATAYHETAHTMMPIKEKGGEAYFTRMYDIRGSRPSKARELGNLTPGDGALYAGRGYPQTTGKDNYKKATVALNKLGFDIDLVADPDLMMTPAVAAATMISGMEEGWFTTRKLPDDLPRRGLASLRQFVMSRDVINGSDDDDQIAAYAIDFQMGLQKGLYREPA